VGADREKARRAAARAVVGVQTLTHRQRRRLEAMPPKPNAYSATFAALSAMSGLSISSIDKFARNNEFESFKPFDRAGRLGVVESFTAMLERRRSEGPRFDELKGKPTASGKPRGRPRNPTKDTDQDQSHAGESHDG
jgi:hypothetical protein